MSRTLSILIADYPSHAVLLKAHFRPYGYQLNIVHDGESACELLKKRPFDLVIVDLMLPGISGFEICQRLKSEKGTRFIPIIAISSVENQNDRLKAIEIGADEYMLKPIDRMELTARVKSLLRMKLMHDDLDTSESILFSLAGALEAKDCYTSGHSERVAKLGVEIGRRMGLKQRDLDSIRKGGLIHDIGKIGTKEAILLKNGKLNVEERNHIEQHSSRGFEICAPLKSLEPCLAIIRSHHERIDGRGYPDGLKGDEIPTAAKITAVADAFDAMTTDRPYRRGMSTADAMERINSERDSGQWDPDCIDALVQSIRHSQL